MKPILDLTKPPSYWQFIFLQSRVNGAQYQGEALPTSISWEWPKSTWFAQRLSEVRRERTREER